MADIKISEMTPGAALTGAELLEMVQSGATFSTTSLGIATFARSHVVEYNAPLTGFSILVDDGVQNLVLEPLGTLAAGTVTLPADPIDGDVVTISSTQIITTLTVAASAGDTIAGAVTTIGANGFVSYVYVLSQTKWFRVG